MFARLPELNHDPQSDPIVGRMNQILFRAEIPLGRLDRRVAEQQLNLLWFAARGAAHFCAAAMKVMRGDSGKTGGGRVGLK